MLAGKVLGKLKDKVVARAKGSNVGQGIQAFRSWKNKPQAPATKPAAPAAPAAKQVRAFKTGIDSNLKVPKVSSLGRGELFSSKTFGGMD